jgi:hypothetical protein
MMNKTEANREGFIFSPDVRDILSNLPAETVHRHLISELTAEEKPKLAEQNQVKDGTHLIL